MSDNAWMALGLLVIVMVAAWALTRKARCNDKFDEMQLKIRARGFQIGFFTALGLMMVLAFLLEMNIITLVTPGLLALTALMVRLCLTKLNLNLILQSTSRASPGSSSSAATSPRS